MMSQTDFISKAVTILIACIGWYVAYWSTIRRDRLSKQRDMRTQYLIEAYRRLESAGNRREPSLESATALESAVADIQLLGSKEEATLARNFALDFAANQQASLDPLLESLRANLRRELKLDDQLGRITYLRINSYKNLQMRSGDDD